ncbi:MAG TPA: hypothetical protein VN759_03755 [Pseudolysinimonas sp.]|nr:hypothetical protein [Pseudolysinimonas sp.]
MALIAAALRLAAVPGWYGDAQYYLQARIGLFLRVLVDRVARMPDDHDVQFVNDTFIG